MGDVVDLFPEGQPVGERLDRDFLDLDVPPRLEMTPTTCGGKMHVFDAVPGRCHCGAEHWQSDGTLSPQPDDGTFGVHLAAASWR